MIMITTNDTTFRCFTEEDNKDLQRTLDEFKISKSGWHGEVWMVYEIFNDSRVDELYTILKDKTYLNNFEFRVFDLREDYHTLDSMRKHKEVV